MLVGIALIELRLAQNGDICLLTRIGRLLDADAIALIAVFRFQNINSLIQLAFRDAKRKVGTFGNINHAFLVNFLLQDVSNLFSLIFLGSNAILVHGADRRFGQVQLLADFSPAFAIFFQCTNLIPLQRFTVMAGFGSCHTKLAGTQLVLIGQSRIDGLKDLIFTHALSLQLIDSRNKIARMLVRRLATTPGITARMTLGAVMLQRIAAVFNTKIARNIFFNWIHVSTPSSALQ